MKKLIILLSFVGHFFIVIADEGMWVPLFLKELNENEMRAMGLKISIEEIYSVNKASMKDAVVLFGGGCTAEIISPNGLLLTNHHCGYDVIQSHSSVERDYLTKGFWAMTMNEELPSQGLEIQILNYMEDVTSKVLEGVTEKMSYEERKKIVNVNIELLRKKYAQNPFQIIRIVPFYYGNQYIMMVYDVFKDVRLVGAPPSSIGKFGGDTDNWMWPRHTGDFTYFRIYADENNQPANYSPKNKPYKPKYFFKISTKGVKEGDFTFVYGYPARTSQYITSHAVNQIVEIRNPLTIELRRKRLDIFEHYMKQSDEIRIKYSAKHSSIANGWKKMIGESRGVRQLKAIEKKQQLEKDFQAWVEADNLRKRKYGDLLNNFEQIYKELEPYEFTNRTFSEAGMAIEIVRFAWNFNKLKDFTNEKNFNLNELKKVTNGLIEETIEFYKDYHIPIDKEVAQTTLPYLQKLGEQFRPAFFVTIEKKYKNNIASYVDYIFTNSLFTKKEQLIKFLESCKSKKEVEKILNDPIFLMASDIYTPYLSVIQPKIQELNGKLEALYNLYMKALMEMFPNRRFYPDANGTLRVAYGKVLPYRPLDGIIYDYYTTTNGILEKSLMDAYDYVIEKELKAFLETGDFGKYADKDGVMKVAFVASNHTTGGNSGSPVLNAEGHLVGINFDRTWESTMSDIIYDAKICRNISVDIRYVLLITEKYAGAKHLIDEMVIIN